MCVCVCVCVCLCVRLMVPTSIYNQQPPLSANVNVKNYNKHKTTFCMSRVYRTVTSRHLLVRESRSSSPPGFTFSAALKFPGSFLTWDQVWIYPLWLLQALLSFALFISLWDDQKLCLWWSLHVFVQLLINLGGHMSCLPPVTGCDETWVCRVDQRQGKMIRSVPWDDSNTFHRVEVCSPTSERRRRGDEFTVANLTAHLEAIILSNLTR